MMTTSYSIEYICHNHLFDGWASRSVWELKIRMHSFFWILREGARDRKRKESRLHIKFICKCQVYFGLDWQQAAAAAVPEHQQLQTFKIWIRDDATTSFFSFESIWLVRCVVHRSNYSSRASIEVSAINRLNECFWSVYTVPANLRCTVCT